MDGGSVARPVLLYDGTCGLCSVAARFVAQRDRRQRFRLVANASAEGRRSLAAHGVASVADETVVLVDAAGAHVRSAAVVRVLRGLGGRWAFLGALLGLVPRPLRDAGYRWVARRRHRDRRPAT